MKEKKKEGAKEGKKGTLTFDKVSKPQINYTTFFALHLSRDCTFRISFAALVVLSKLVDGALASKSKMSDLSQ